jgi:CBS domain-containing protein
MNDKKVKDLMLPLAEYATISAESTIREALVALNKAQMGLTYDRHHHRAILVIDETGEVVGKLTHHSILASLEPRLLGSVDLRQLDRAGLTQEFISSMEESAVNLNLTLERMCAEAGRRKVEQAMVPTIESIEEEAPLAEAIHLIVRKHVQSVLVTRSDRVVGILRTSDVFEEVADMIRSTEGCRDAQG